MCRLHACAQTKAYDMADIASRIEIGVTTGPLPGSSKIHVGPLRVAMREIALDPSVIEASPIPRAFPNRPLISRGWKATPPLPA